MNLRDNLLHDILKSEGVCTGSLLIVLTVEIRGLERSQLAY